MSDILNALLAAALTTAGYAVKNRAESKAAKERSAILRQMEALSSGATNKQLAITQQQAQTYAPAQRLPALDQIEGRNVQRLQQDLIGPGTAVDGPVYGGKVSDAYVQGKAQRVAADLGYSTRLASLMGRVQAPADLALQQGYAGADAATSRAGIRANLHGDLDVENLALSAAEPNGGILQAGDFLQGAGLAVGTPRGDVGFGAPAPAPATGGASSIPAGAPPVLRNRMANAVPGRASGVNRSSQNAMLKRSSAAPGMPRPGTAAYWAGR